MLQFNPPELKDKLIKAIELITKKLEIDLIDISQEIIDPSDKDFSPDKLNDLIITPETRFPIWLPECDESVDISYKGFIELANELDTARMVNNVECWSNRRYLLRVEAISEEAEIINHLYDTESSFLSDKYFKINSTIDDQEVEVSLKKGITIFGFLVTKTGNYEKIYPPVLAEDLFVEVKFEKLIDEEIIRNLAEAYIFEMSCSTGIDLARSPRAEIDFDWYTSQSDEGFAKKMSVRLRELMTGKGMIELLRLYNSAIATHDADFQILYFAKVIEYVSQTVIRQQATETIRTKLLSRSALNPDASFIRELQCIIENQQTLRKDREAIDITVRTCCDATELAKHAPPFLGDLRKISAESKRKELESALAKFALSLVSTRNSIAHAKANYIPTGDECPGDQKNEFSKLVKIASQQVIRWYNARHEIYRI